MSLHLKHLLQHVAFSPIDPLGDGLREEIIAEQNEPDRIVLKEQPNEGDLISYLESITSDIHGDADEFTFSED
jgi:hypothetical protein